MPSFRDKLLADVSSLCQQLYERRLAAVQEQALVSEKSKQDIARLIFHLNQLFLLNPFPDERAVDRSPIDQLRRDIDAADHDQDLVEQQLMDWVKGLSPAVESTGNEASATARSKGGTTPINQRMIDNLQTFRSTIDQTRVRLLRERDRYDQEEYTAARNAFTLARDVYAERLRLNQIKATNEGCADMEQVMIPAVEEATGATFPAAIQAGADFTSTNIFV
jgi:hypothetical protein